MKNIDKVLIPNDYSDMSLEDLYALDDLIGSRSNQGQTEFHKLIEVRDAAQAQVAAFQQRGHDITKAILEKLVERNLPPKAK